MSPIRATKDVLFAPIHWPAFLLVSVVLMMLWSFLYYGSIVPDRRFEIYRADPVVVDPITKEPKDVWHPGETFGVRYDTQILRDCPAVYEYWMRRADGLSYGPPALGPNHFGHYRKKQHPEGQEFIALGRLPEDVLPGQYAWQPRVTAMCSFLRATVEDAPPVLITVERAKTSMEE